MRCQDPSIQQPLVDHVPAQSLPSRLWHRPNGGAIALGHPVGATGAILTTKCLYELKRINGKYGLVTMCIGGGQGIAAIFEVL